MIIEEQVDVVNEKDEVISATSKKEAHAKGLLHRTVIAEVIGSDGSWTLVKQASHKQDAGQYVSPVGGHVKARESEEDALRREAEEECGLTGDLRFKLVGKKIFNRTVIGRKENHYFIMYEITTDQKIILNDESVGLKKFTVDELKKEMKQNPKNFGNAFHFVVHTFYPTLM